MDDHVKDLIESTSGSLTPVQVLKALEETIDNFLEEIKYTQLSMEFSETIAYVTNKKLKNIFNLPLDACLRAIEAQAMLFDLLYLERIAEANRSQYASKTSSFLPSVEMLIISEQRPEIKNRYCIQIKQSLLFFGRVVRNLDKFDPSIQCEIRAHLSARLEKYHEYVLVLNNRVDQESVIDTTLIRHLRVELAAENMLAQELQQQTL